MITRNNNAEMPSGAARIAWLVILTLAGLGGSLVISCVTPFVALAVALAGTVRLAVALRAMTAIWLLNQLIGFVFLNFPRTPNSFLWGLAIGGTALVTTVAAARVLKRTVTFPTLARLGFALLVGFAVYKSTLFVAALLLGGVETFSPAIISQVGFVNFLSFFGLTVLNELVAVLLKPWLGPAPRLAKA